jgi:peptide/nickel transport system permease protein
MSRLGKGDNQGSTVMATAEAQLSRQRTVSATIFRWAKKLSFLSVILLAPLIIWGIFGPLLYPHDPTAVNLAIAYRPPSWMAGGVPTYFLGTDQLGRDLLTRMIEGARASLLVGVFGVIFSGIIGVSLGLVAGYFGGETDNVIMRIVDTWMAIPGMFFMLLLVVLMRQIGISGLTPIIVAISLTMWTGYTRVVRGDTLSQKQREFVALARVTGSSNSRIMMKHIFPNIMNTIVVMATTQLGGAIMMEAGMSFLGVGVQPPNTAWGLLISESSTYMSSAWWIPTFAGLAITVTILGANLFGDWLRDALDPRSRQL